MKLIHPSEKYLRCYKDFIIEDSKYRSNCEQIFNNPDTIIQDIYNYEHGINLRPGYVPCTTLWLVDGDKYIGQVSIRHKLTPLLLQYAGHIGYEIRYSECKKGYGTKLLAMALRYAKEELGLEHILITCDDDNIASIKIIEANRGVLENKVINHLDRGDVTTRRYWINM